MLNNVMLQKLVAVAIAMTLAGLNVSAQPIAERLSDHADYTIVQFHADEDAKQGRVPSFALESLPVVRGEAPRDFPVVVTLTTDDQGRQVSTIAIDPGTSLYGTGQVAGPLERSGNVSETWNWDSYGYTTGSRKSLYTSHPWVLAVRADGSSFGVLADTTYRTEMDLTGSDAIVFRAEGPEHPVVIINADSPQGVMHGLGELTGTIEMPPKWAIGYHQCRYSYFPDERVLEVARGFRERQLPADVIWMDIDYMDGFRCFTFDQEHFPNPAKLNRDLDDLGFSNIWMIDPGLKNEDGYFVHDEGDRLLGGTGAWVQRADGSEFTGHVWPGECVFPDYTNREVREWWAGLYQDFMANGIDGVWNDMNEPAVFKLKPNGEIETAITMPEDNIHRADPELGGHATHDRFHNVYGMLMVKASREGIMEANPGKRPFVLSRANFMGGHRYGATWTGDNRATWEHVDISIPMTLNLGLSGQPFAGPDLGGFVGDGDPELFARWFGFGALFPFARGHTEKGSRDKEPWSYGPEVEATARRALERRYRFIPHYYTLFEESHRTGIPIARPVFFADPKDPSLREIDDAFMLGDNLIVAAQPKQSRDRAELTLPTNTRWTAFDFVGFDNTPDSEDPNQPKLYIKHGEIIPTGPVHQHFGDRPSQLDEITLLVALDDAGRASGELYEDAGEGWDFRTGNFLRTRYDAVLKNGNVMINTTSVGGAMPRPNRNLEIRLMTPDGREVTASGRDGTTITLKYTR